jgi:hypothetical protein
MRRLWSLLCVTVLVAACSSAPQQASRRPAGSAGTAANRTFATPSGFPDFVDHSVGREEISIQAMALVGVPYRWGGNTPEAGFDCSGLVRYVVDRAAAVNLPRTTADMSGRGESIEPDEVAPGDLIFFNTTGRPHSHVGIYVGKLRFVNAPSTGGTVRLDYLTNPYWAKRFDGIRRVAPPKAPPNRFDSPTYLASGQAPAGGSLSAVPRQTGPAEVVSPPRVAAGDSFEPPPQAMSAAQRQAQTAGAISPPRVATADSFEPPLQAMSAAQRQAQTTGTISPPRVATADSFEPPPQAMSAAQRQAQTAGAVSPPRAAAADAYEPPPTASRAPDPIDAAADAFEPPPPTARLAAQQARSAQQSAARIPAADPAVHVMRASTGSLAPRPAAADDPIAKFANGGE